jgi:predicted MFS family arabinose efflux permease
VTEHRAWAPLRTRAFRALWIANLVSNVGTVMHTVGAGWAMTSLTASPAVVALAQVAWSVPGFLFALPAGALADLFDRRVVMRASQIVAMCIAALFGVLHLTGHLGVVALLAGTFLLSVSLTLSAPIFSAIIPDLVAPDDVPQAIGLNSVAYNGAQSLGPALGGVLVAAAGPAAVFLLNAVSFLGIVAVAGGWPARADHDDSERPLAAMRAGISHVRHDRRLAPIALRITLAFFASSAIVALLPVVARTRLRAEAWQFGLLSASLGAGVVVAVMVQPRLRGRMRTDSTVFVASALWAVGAAVLGWTTHLAVAIPALLLAGTGAMLTSNTMWSLFLLRTPARVRGRASSISMLAVWLGTSVGAIAWGALASRTSVATALVGAAGLHLVVTALATLWLRLGDDDTGTVAA